MSGYFVTGTGTDIGKTVVTSLLVEYLNVGHRTYFPYKPIQTGAYEVDGEYVAPDPEVYKLSMEGALRDKCYTYLLKTASSPHFAAARENIIFDLSMIHRDINAIKESNDGIIVEGAGGLYVPITEDGYCMIDLMKDLLLPVILVGEAGLGTINHTVLSIKALQANDIPIAGVIVNGTNQENEMLEKDNIKMIERLTNIQVIGTIPFVQNIESLLKDKEQRKSLTASWNDQMIRNHAK
ncbi:MAG TPA: dethiobiotin synthase [Virgibacillus sp.]|nr:dethiobiotin synthase [Virgibacillus sp.]